MDYDVPIIGSAGEWEDKKAKKEAEFNRKRIEHFAKKYIDKTYSGKCPKCRAKGLKPVSLFELPSHFPSSIVIYCPKCHWSENFATALVANPSEEKKEADKKLADELIADTPEPPKK